MSDLINAIDLQVVSNILTVALVLYIVVYMMILFIDKRKREHLLNLHKKKNSAQKLGERFESIQKFYGELEDSLKRSKNESIADLIFYGVIAITVVIAISMMLTGQYVLAISYPVAFIWFVRLISRTAVKDEVIELEEELPVVIDNMIRIFSKYSDIKNLLYETSLTTNGSMKAEINLLSRQMNSRNPYVVLEEFSEKHDSVWLNSLGFTLMGYLQDGTKDETIRNLRHLRSILETENKTKKKAISERKPSLMLNYALATIGALAALANIVFNPQAFNFFFHSYLGLFCFTAGFAFILGTIYMNIKMMKIEK